MDGRTIEITPLTKPYWEALEAGVLSFQYCGACGHRWLPAREACPQCLQADWLSWVPSRGAGKVVSWVVYHVAYDPAFKERLPYNVAIVELEEGPRLITNLKMPNENIAPNLAVSLAPERRLNVTLPCFKPAE